MLTADQLALALERLLHASAQRDDAQAALELARSDRPHNAVRLMRCEAELQRATEHYQAARSAARTALREHSRDEWPSVALQVSEGEHADVLGAAPGRVIPLREVSR